ncbi:hypothetical protein Btru_012372 [Bulinus truncatus]|nr:hypothetical protein Btru_012372 [Bulinus truncatus]
MSNGTNVILLCLIVLHTVTSQNTTGTAPVDASIQADVTSTVMALLNETGYSGNASDAKVQQIVTMLMNGQTPTDQDLINLGIIPATQIVTTTPPTYVVPGAVAPTDPLLVNVAPGGTQPALPTPAPATNTGGTGGGPVFPSFPSFPSSGTGGTFPTFPSGGGSIPNFNGLFPNILAPSTTTTKPSSVDIMGLLTGGGGSGGGGGISNLNPTIPNAVGPKPQPTDPMFPGLFPNMGNPGGINPPPTGGILDTQHQQRVQQQQQNPMNNPMMMMMMMNPELMDTMLSGENPMMMYMFMQQMQGNKKPAPRPQTPPMNMMDMMGGGAAGGVGSLPGSSGGLSGLPGLSGLDMMGSTGMGPLSGASSMSGGMGTGLSSTNFLDPMSMMSKLGTGGAPLPAAGGAGMDFTSMLNSLGPLGGGLSPSGSTGGAPGTDMMMNNLASLINSPPPTSGALPSPTPLDPFVGTMG